VIKYALSQRNLTPPSVSLGAILLTVPSLLRVVALYVERRVAAGRHPIFDSSEMTVRTLSFKFME